MMQAGFVLLLAIVVFVPKASEGANDAYRKVAQERAARIVETMKLSDPDQQGRVVKLVAEQYVALADAHAAAEASRDEVASKVTLFDLHRNFVASLEAELDAAGVEAVKDGMTYGVVPITYAGYLRLLPDLSDDQKRMIRACLVEAREYAMDAGSSEEKHGWFGKYKGRINNRLSQAGYDLKQAEKALSEREASAKPQKAAAN